MVYVNRVVNSSVENKRKGGEKTPQKSLNLQNPQKNAT